MRIVSGTTTRYIYFVAVDNTDGVTRETGLSSFTVYRSRDGGAAAAMTTPTINETDATNMPGVYELLLDEDTTIGSGNDSEEMAFHITATGMRPVTRVIEIYRPKITAGNTLTVSAGGNANTAVQSIAANAITATAIASGAITSAKFAASAITSTVMAANAIGASQIASNAITSAKIATDAIGAAQIAADAIGSSELATSAVNEIVDQVWDELQSEHVTAGSFGEIATETAAILADTAEIGTAGAGLTAVPWNAAWDAEVESECNDALVALHLDHLLAVDYDPAAKPGVATALLNEIVESDAGVSRFTANALEQGPDTTTGLSVDTVNDKTGYSISGTKTTLDALNDITAAAAADAVWDEATAGHATPSTFGVAVTDILADTAVIGTPAGASIAADIADLDGDVAALNNLDAATVKTQIVEALNTDTYAEPTGIPAATATLVDKIGRVHQALRNRVTVTSTKKTYYSDADTALWEKDLSDNGTTYDESEGNAI